MLATYGRFSAFRIPLNKNLDQKPVRSIPELEERSRSESQRFQFGLGKLIVISNLAGAALAFLITSPDRSLASTLFIGLMIGCAAPCIVLVHMAFILLRDKVSSRSARETPTKREQETSLENEPKG